MKKIVAIIALMIFVVGCSNCGKQLTIEDLLDEMVSMESLCEFPSVEYWQMQTSSHDRRSDNPQTKEDWFANNDGFGIIRTDTIDGRIEKVIFEENHPGVITRIWITTHSPRSTVRFYFDGHLAPDWIIPAYDLHRFGLAALGEGLLNTHTSYEVGVKGGSTLFLPIPYGRSCKITLEEPTGWSGVPRYFQANFRRYSDDVQIESFSVEVAKRASDKIAETSKILTSPICVKGRTTMMDGVLASGESLSLDLPKGERVVRSIVVRCKDVENWGEATRRLIVRMSFDGVQTVCVPLSDFVGAGMGTPEVKSRWLNSDGKESVGAGWLMPYRNSATLSIENIADNNATVEVEVVTTRYNWNERSLYFHSSWRSEYGLAVTNNHKECYDWRFATLKGRGVYRGDMLTLFNYAKAWYGEGDEKIYVDGEEFPSHFGTGTEDYYNSSWAPVVPFHTPFGGAPRADLASSKGYNTWVRTRALDAIPFKESLVFDLEMISWVPGTVDYSTAVYWYGDLDSVAEGITDVVEAKREMPEPPADPSKFVISNSVEFEALEVVAKSEALQVDRQGMLGFPDGVWSGGKQVTCFGGSKGDWIRIDLPVEEDGVYNVKLHATKAADYGKVQFLLGGKIAGVLDSYFAAVVNSGEINLGSTKSENNKISLEVRIIGKNPKSLGYMFGLDCAVLEKVE